MANDAVTAIDESPYALVYLVCITPDCVNEPLSPAAECILCIKKQAKRLGEPGPA